MVRILQIICFFFIVSHVTAQNKYWNGTAANWEYDFSGARNSDHIAAAGSDVVLIKAATATNFYTVSSTNITTPQSTATATGWLPAPAGSSTVIQLRAATAARVVYNFVKEGAELKSLKIDATNGLGKFIIRSIDNTKASAIAKYSFTLKTHYKNTTGNTVTPGYVRSYDLVFGSNSTGTGASDQGSMFRGGNGITTAERLYDDGAVFTSFRLAYEVGKSSMIFSHRKVVTKYDVSKSLEGTAQYNAIPGTSASFAADGTSSEMELYCNNSPLTQYYVVDNSIYAVTSQTLHLWMNGNKIGEYDIAAPGQAPLSAGKTFDSFMVYTTAASGTQELGYGAIELANFKVSYVGTTSSTLPVSLATFTGNYGGSTVKLNWKTLSENDNSHFELMRSGDGISFTEIAQVQGKGNSSETNYYNSTDYHPLAGVNYYRLKQVDFNGDFDFSHIIAVNTLPLNNIFKAVNKEGGLDVSLFSKDPSIKNVYVTDVNGRKVSTSKIRMVAGENHFEVTLPALNTGLYVLSVEGAEEVQRLKFLK